MTLQQVHTALRRLAKNCLSIVVLGVVAANAAAPSKPAYATAAAQPKEADMTVFGIRLGEKFSIPECKREQDRQFPYGFDFVSAQFICFRREDVRRWKPNEPVDTDEVEIMLPDKDTPLGVMNHVVAFENNSTGAIVAQIVDGNIEVVTIYTMGVRFQDVVLAMLKGKYGEPTSLKEVSKENGFGAVFTSHVVEWFQYTNLMVTFDGTEDRTDVGSIDIWTHKGGEYISERAKQKTQVGPKL